MTDKKLTVEEIEEIDKSTIKGDLFASVRLDKYRLLRDAAIRGARESTEDCICDVPGFGMNLSCPVHGNAEATAMSRDGFEYLAEEYSQIGHLTRPQMDRLFAAARKQVQAEPSIDLATVALANYPDADAGKLGAAIAAVRPTFERDAYERGLADALAQADVVHVVFDGLPGPEGPRFIDTETPDGKGIGVGEWVPHGKFWALAIKVHYGTIRTTFKKSEVNAGLRSARDE